MQFCTKLAWELTIIFKNKFHPAPPRSTLADLLAGKLLMAVIKSPRATLELV